MDAADFERASETILAMLRLMSETEREWMLGRIRAVWCWHCGSDSCTGWCTYDSPLDVD